MCNRKWKWAGMEGMEGESQRKPHPMAIRQTSDVGRNGEWNGKGGVVKFQENGHMQQPSREQQVWQVTGRMYGY